MAFIGNRPADTFHTTVKQSFTPDSSTTAFTLSQTVSNENEIELNEVNYLLPKKKPNLAKDQIVPKKKEVIKKIAEVEKKIEGVIITPPKPNIVTKIKPPKKLDSKSCAAKPTARPPIPPKARTPEILNPIVCRIINAAIITIEALESFMMASRVVESIVSKLER